LFLALAQDNNIPFCVVFGSNVVYMCIPKIAGNKYLNIDPTIQMISIKVERIANPSPRVEISVEPRLPNSSCPDSLRLLFLRFLTQI
jgi:hypothetical protein